MQKPRVSGRFLPGPDGPLALVVWEPPLEVALRFSMLHLPAAGEEMNKSRRMAALQARAFAAIGGRVVLLDPRGTGDSGGDHGAATWDGWRDDVVVAWSWLERESRVPCLLWGVRLGALLAADLVAAGRIAPAALLLWQPVASGRTFFTQLLRVATAQQITGRGDFGTDPSALRTAFAEGRSVEVAGYDLNPELVTVAESVDMTALAAPPCHVLWRETSIEAQPGLSPWARNIVARWAAAGVEVDAAAANGPSFWAAQEIAEAPHLITATTAAVAAWLGRGAGGAG